MNHNQMDRRRFLRVAGLGAGGAVLLGTVGACGSSQAGSGKLEFAVAHLKDIVAAAPFLIADELGYFQDEKLAPDMVSFPGGTDTVRGIVSGMPFGMPATLSALIAYQKGQKNLRLISGAVNTALTTFLVRADSPIHNAGDLRGKKIAVSEPGSITTYFADRIVTSQGLTPGKDVQILNVGEPPDAWTAVKQGLADVAWSSPPASNSLTLDGSARVLFDTSHFVTQWVDNTYWTTQEFIDSSPDVIKAILRAMQKSFTTIKNDVGTAAPAYAKRAGITVDVAKSALEQVAPSFDLGIDLPGIEANVQAGAGLGQLDAKAINLDEIIVRQFVEAL